MKHLFASGEEIYKKNVIELEQGTFVAKHLEYPGIAEDTEFRAIGTIGDRDVMVKFKIKSDCFGDIRFRHSVNILMQSDLIQTTWEYYNVHFL